MNEQTTFSFEESKLTQSGECSLDAADTLSDASSFTSPESSEKSMRTKSIQHMTSSKDNATVNNSISCSTSTVLSNCIETNSCEGSIEAPEKYQEESLANDINRRPVSGIDIRREINKSEAKNYHSNAEGTTEVLIKMMNSYQHKEHTVENGSLHSIDSNESAISSQYGDMEKLQTIETDSNDSHSSVLDENSLSYNSDDSEYKHLVEIKNKDSLSSVLDENSALSSFCDDSEKV
ncbi:a-kinase anchor protein 1, mitochondrial [Caerostris extrusa]|uniref:A-kinase anchor protein 1, mitochondrial n=1 Tax=Caerostris extrusa TaxID=172846 RepID=A0AAV4NBV5_CAEEX|nr:a-kinase anchor protein 1, mitochondrial [Caerostris extrusa]